MLDESAQAILDAIENEVSIFERELREQSRFPVDALPVTVNQVATYRNLYLHTLRQLINKTDRLRRLLAHGGDPVADLMSELDSKLPIPDGRRYPRCSDPGEDGDR